MKFLKLEDYLVYEQPTKYIVDSENYSDKYDIPVLTAGKSFILGYTNEKTNIFPKEKLPVIIFDDFTTECKYVDFPFKVKSSAMKILHPTENANPKFLYYFMKQIKFDNTLHKRYWISQYSKIEVPELSKEEQDEFASEMKIIEDLIELRKKQIDKCDFLIKSQFEEMFGKCASEDLIGNLISISRGASPRPINDYITEDEHGINWIKIGDVSESSLYITSTKEKITEKGADKSRRVKKGDFILSNSMSFGRPYILKIDGCVHDGWLIMTNFRNSFNEIYLYYALRDNYVQSQFNNKVNGATVKNLNSDLVKETSIKVPPIELQNKFAKFVEKVDKQKSDFEKSLKKIEELQTSLMQEYFG